MQEVINKMTREVKVFSEQALDTLEKLHQTLEEYPKANPVSLKMNLDNANNAFDICKILTEEMQALAQKELVGLEQLKFGHHDTKMTEFITEKVTQINSTAPQNLVKVLIELNEQIVKLKNAEITKDIKGAIRQYK
ncbi:MAG: hypothetical protein ACRCXC_03795 [Legionella sp.]